MSVFDNILDIPSTCYRIGVLKSNSLEPLEDSCRLRLSAAI